MRASFNFLVCRAMHDSRTRPLWQTTCAMLARDWPTTTVSLLGGFDPFDDVPVTRVSDADDYDSCHDKLFSIFDRTSNADWHIVADDDTWFNIANLALLLPGLPCHTPLICGMVCPARIPDAPPLPHAHGGAGILINASAFRALSYSPAPRPRHPKHSDVSLALWVEAHNSTGGPQIGWAHIVGMHGPDDPLDRIDPAEAISIHTKDRASFADLYARAGLA
jgi:hypothetical protein